jgi:hypothetical protein
MPHFTLRSNRFSLREFAAESLKYPARESFRRLDATPNYFSKILINNERNTWSGGFTSQESDCRRNTRSVTSRSDLAFMGLAGLEDGIVVSFQFAERWSNSLGFHRLRM